MFRRLAVGAALVLTGCATSVARAPHVLVLRPARSNGVLVVYNHGRGESIDALKTDPEKRPITEALLAAGYTLATSDAEGNAWGSVKAVQDYSRLPTVVGGRFAATVILAQSMGGLSGLECAAERCLPNLRALAAIYPVFFRSAMAGTKYGREVAAAPPAPAVDSSAVTIPIIVWESPQDSVALKTANADRLAAALRAHGDDVEVIATRGEHGDPSNFGPAEVVRFFDRTTGQVRSAP